MDIPNDHQTFDSANITASALRLAPFLFPQEVVADDPNLEVSTLTQGTTNGVGLQLHDTITHARFGGNSVLTPASS